MKVLFDTSICIAAMIESHPKHQLALPWMQQGKRKEIELIVSAHTIAECYAVLTTLPVKPRIASGIARRLIHENIEQIAQVVSLTPNDYKVIIKQLSEKGMTGGIIYDALIARVAEKSKVDRLLTLNISHFRKIWPGDPAVLREP